MGYVTIDNTSDVKKTSKSTSQQKQNMFWLSLIRNKYVQSGIFSITKYVPHLLIMDLRNVFLFIEKKLTLNNPVHTKI